MSELIPYRISRESVCVESGEEEGRPGMSKGVARPWRAWSAVLRMDLVLEAVGRFEWP